MILAGERGSGTFASLWPFRLNVCWKSSSWKRASASVIRAQARGAAGDINAAHDLHGNDLITVGPGLPSVGLEFEPSVSPATCPSACRMECG